MRILLLSTSFPREEGDWAGSFVLELAASLARRHEVNVVTPNFPGGKKSDELSGVAIKRFDYAFPRSSQCVIYPDGIPDQLKKSALARTQLPLFLASFIRATVSASRHADVILCNWVATGAIAKQASWFTRKPYIVVVRGSDMRTMEKDGQASRQSVKALRDAKAVCTVAEDFVEPLKVLGAEKVFFTPNGLNVETFKPDHGPRTTDHDETAGDELRKTVLFVGSLIERKGLRYLIEAMTGVDARLVVVGEGHLAGQLQALAKEKGVEAEFVGKVPTHKTPEYYAAADVFVLPSLYEGRPNVLMEAMASGCACVATEIQGTRELIQDGVDGFLVAPGGVEKLSTIIKSLLDGEELRTMLAANAADEIRRRVPSWDECAANYEKVLTDVVSGG